MIIEFITDFGAWSWFLLGIVLLIGEVVLPGAYLLWFGLAAITVGTLSLMFFNDSEWWPWQIQVLAFGVLSLVYVLIGRRVFPSTSHDDAASKINDPLHRLVGSEAELTEPVRNGVGKIHLGDTLWRVKGKDMPVGTKVRVTGTDGSALFVEPV